MAQCGVFFWDASANRHYVVSENFARFLGLEKCNLVPDDISHLVSDESKAYLLSPIHPHQNHFSIATIIDSVRYVVDFQRTTVYTDSDGVQHATGTAQVVQSEKLLQGQDNDSIHSSSLGEKLISQLREIGRNDFELYEQITNLLRAFSDWLPAGMEVSVWQRLLGDEFCCIGTEGDIGSDQAMQVRSGARLVSPLFAHVCNGHGIKIISNLDDIRGEWNYEMDLLRSVGCHSVIGEGIRRTPTEVAWGMVGIMADRAKVWTDADRRWLHMLTECLSVFVSQSVTSEHLREALSLTQVAVKSAGISLWRYQLLTHQRFRLSSSGRQVEIPFDLLIHRKDIALFDQNFMSLASGSTDNFATRLRMRQKEGDEYQWFDIALHVAKLTPDGRPEVIVAAARNVDSEVKSAQVEKERQEYLDSIYNKIPAVVAFISPEGNINFANDKAVEVFGLRRKTDLYGVNIFNSPITTNEQKVLIRTQDNNQFFVHYDFARIATSGFFRTSRTGVAEFLLRYSKLYSAGHMVGFLAVFLDNSVATAQQFRLNVFNDFFSEIGRIAGIGICRQENPSLFPDGVYATPQWMTNFALPSDATPNQYTLQALLSNPNIPTDERAAISFDISQLRATEVTSFCRTLHIAHPDGSTAYIDLYVIVDSSGGYSALSVDVSEAKRSEANLIKARKKAEYIQFIKSQFLSGVNHELRTPLNAVIGFSELIANSAASPDATRYASIVRSSGMQLTKIVDNVIEMSHLTTEPHTKHLASVNVDNFLLLICQKFASQAPEGVSLICSNQHSPTGLTVLFDDVAVEKVLSHLVDNAFANTRSGHVKLSADVSKSDITFHVEDTGQGIDAPVIDHIFDPFVKSDVFVAGIGLGLTISKSIDEILGGKMFVKSERGQGSHFWFTLPLNYSESPTSTADNVLVLSSDENIMNTISNQLAGHNIIRSEFPNFTSMWMDAPPPLTIIDSRACPDITNFLVSSIRAYGPSCRIVVISPTPDAAVRADFISAGADEVVMLPLDDNLLEKLTGKKKQQQCLPTVKNL